MASAETHNRSALGQSWATRPAGMAESGSIPIRLLLVIPCAFFIPWGAGLQKVANVDLSKVFVLFAVALIAYWVLFTRRMLRVFPRYLNLFVLLVTFHTIVTYLFLHPDELTFGYSNLRESADGFVLVNESRGIGVARLFLFVAFAYALASLVRTPRELVAVCLAYGSGFLASLLLGSRVLELLTKSYIRSTGGYLNPNSLGQAAMVCVLLNLFAVQSRHVSVKIRLLAVSFVLAGLYGLALSASRTSIIALCAGLMVMLYYQPSGNRLRNMAGLLLVAAAVFAYLPDTTVHTLKGRTGAVYTERLESNTRIIIWGDYLRQFHNYALFGVGLKRSTEVTKETYTTHALLIPHNTPIHLLVEFGCLGLLLFLAAMCQLWRRIAALKPAEKRWATDPVMLGLLAAWACFFITGSYGSRPFWMSWAILAAYGKWKQDARQLEPGTQQSQTTQPPETPSTQLQ